MIWLTWRRHRFAVAAFTALFLAIVAVYLLSGPLGSDARTVYTFASGFARLVKAGEDVCGFMLLPLLVGMFAGAPLVSRELERRTFRYAWTQGVSRTHWLRTEVLLVGGAILLISTLYSATHMLWFAPLVPEEGWFRIFNQGVVVFPASCLFAFAFGVLAGTVLKRTVPAMVAALVGSAVVFSALGYLRPHYMAPLHRTQVEDGRLAPTTGESLRDDFIVYSQSGPAGYSPDTGVSTWAYTYHPAERFWTFQVVEAGIHLGLVMVCLVAAFWWLNRKTA